MQVPTTKCNRSSRKQQLFIFKTLIQSSLESHKIDFVVIDIVAFYKLITNGTISSFGVILYRVITARKTFKSFNLKTPPWAFLIFFRLPQSVCLLTNVKYPPRVFVFRYRPRVGISEQQGTRGWQGWIVTDNSTKELYVTSCADRFSTDFFLNFDMKKIVQMREVETS